ncbi:MFS transporter [Frondihabitans australicus]|uniref:EmrB/QacA subfamily drug resistance transporter n=1 Tax=Frondihabitans australicus TaxID=386892 RepID=A0A495IKU9_9MICO|nr:MFS transporter [Frondihabitans australicus]RKR75911.1 EmrB/QacA subfamily drug resistance transporter [Frondihabitans australicus]
MTTTRSNTTEGATRAAPPVHKTAILVIILVSYFMILLDNSIIFTGLPSIQRTLGFSSTGLAWVQDAYTLTFGGLLLLASRAGDILGRRRLFIIGLIVFSGASLFVGASPVGSWMVAARAVQGIGAAIVAPTSLSLLTATFPAGRERNRAVALYSATAGIGASLGMVIGGVLADLVSWRAGFFINIPIGAVMIVLATKYLVEQPKRPGKFDVLGAVTSTVGIGAIIFGIIESSSRGWASPVTLVSIAVGAALLVVLVVHEARAAEPIMPLRLFVSRHRSGAYAVRFLYLGAMMGFFFFTTQYLQEVHGWNPLQAGLGFLPMTAVNFAVALNVTRLGRFIRPVPMLAIGVILTLAGMFWLSLVTADTGYIVSVGLPMLLIGAGQGLAFAPLTSFGISGVEAHDAGAASGLLNTAHQLGSSVGLAILVAVGAGAVAAHESTTAAVIARVHGALTGSSVMLAVALVVSLVFHHRNSLVFHRRKEFQS